jgi:large subunit ribosomal protein L29
MDYKDLLALETEELQQQLITQQKLLHKLQFAHAISPIENPSRIRKARRTIARIHTILAKVDAKPKASPEAKVDTKIDTNPST